MKRTCPAVWTGALIWLVGCASPMNVGVLAPIGPATGSQMKIADKGSLRVRRAMKQALATPCVNGLAPEVAGPKTAPETANTVPWHAKQFVQARPPASFLENGPGLELGPAKPNETGLGKLSFSGIAVQLLKAENPLQLLNPAAPAQYGSGMDNLDQVSFSGTGPLLKIFSIAF